MSAAPRILVIRPGKERESALRSLARTDAEIVVADHPDNDLAGFADLQLPLPRVASAFQEGRSGDLEKRILDFHSRYPLSAVMTDYDYVLPLVGRLNDQLGLRGHTERSGLTCSNKLLQRAALERFEVAQPRWAECPDIETARGFADSVGWPVVVKPADRAASCAVAVVRTEDQLERALDNALHESWAAEAIVEEYIDGPEFSVEAVAVDGTVTTVAITGKGIGGRTGTLKLDAEIPAQLDGEDLAGVVAIAADAVLACGLRNGPAHTEVRLTASGPKIVEVNGRVGGVFISHMVRAVTGVDLYRAWYDVLLGRKAELVVEQRGFAVRRCIDGGEGLVKSVDIEDIPIELLERHLLTRCFVQPGDDLAPIENGNEMRAAVVSFAARRDEAVAAANALAGSIRIEVQATTEGRRR
jgi:biotin carboxylase